MTMPASSAPYKLGLNHVGYTTLVICIFFMAFSILAAALRVWTRVVKRAKFGIDDWLLIASVILFFPFCANILYFKSEYAIPPLYAINVTTIKLSILFFYRRIFTTDSFLRNNYIIIGICTVWFVVAIIGDLLYCIPMATFWNPEVKGKCFNFPLYFLVMELVDMLLDIAILCLPLKIILSLHMPLSKRLGILCIFLLGALVVVTSAIRIGYVYKPSASLLSLAQASLWSVINLGVAILCACLPTYKPLFGKFHTIGTSLWTNHFSANSGSSTTKAAPDSHSNPTAYYYRMGDSNGDNIHMTGVSTQIQSGNKAQSLPSDGVRVQRDVHVS
ncbi:hypothetical protein BOTNAR_0233g00030 [Botryotinia narcissicola]|uniref:Rhodopsin domain-containing protein n=1 Tax=Botryotinia narcissicola TaxID=278944 RepID=A0A4Z1IGV7_9HELO|nr:hypothetical protein BOTNAR_0233g00030 [Botryotinia narcissicola]